jgi:hypothetical protein
MPSIVANPRVSTASAPQTTSIAPVPGHPAGPVTVPSREFNNGGLGFTGFISMTVGAATGIFSAALPERRFVPGIIAGVALLGAGAAGTIIGFRTHPSTTTSHAVATGFDTKAEALDAKAAIDATRPSNYWTRAVEATDGKFAIVDDGLINND